MSPRPWLVTRDSSPLAQLEGLSIMHRKGMEWGIHETEIATIRMVCFILAELWWEFRKWWKHCTGKRPSTPKLQYLYWWIWRKIRQLHHPFGYQSSERTCLRAMKRNWEIHLSRQRLSVFPPLSKMSKPIAKRWIHRCEAFFWRNLTQSKMLVEVSNLNPNGLFMVDWIILHSGSMPNRSSRSDARILSPSPRGKDNAHKAQLAWQVIQMRWLIAFASPVGR